MRWCSLIGHRWSAGNYCVRCQAVNLKASGAQTPSPSGCAPELAQHIATHYPGYRIVDGELLYSAAWLDDNADDPIGTTG